MFCCTTFTTSQRHGSDCEFSQPSTVCVNHRIIAHDAEGLERWCDFCGRDAEGIQVKRPAGGWGTPNPTTV